MIVCFHMAAFLVNEYCFTPEWQRHVRDITLELVECMLLAREESHGPSTHKSAACISP